jgi:hypothetical protein
MPEVRPGERTPIPRAPHLLYPHTIGEGAVLFMEEGTSPADLPAGEVDALLSTPEW